VHCHVHKLIFTPLSRDDAGQIKRQESGIDRPLLLHMSQKDFALFAKRRRAFSIFFYMSQTCMTLMPASLCSWCCCYVQD